MILKIFDKKEHCTIILPITQTKIITNSSAFVDDQNAFNNISQHNLPQLLKNTQAASQRWAHLIYGIAGEIHINKKTTIMVLATKEYYGKKVYLNKRKIYSKCKKVRIKSGSELNKTELETLEAHEATQYLGAWLPLTGEMNMQYTKCIEIIKLWIDTAS